MARDSRESPHEAPGELPRRVPGEYDAPTPPKVRRGYLPASLSDSAQPELAMGSRPARRHLLPDDAELPRRIRAPSASTAPVITGTDRESGGRVQDSFADAASLVALTSAGGLLTRSALPGAIATPDVIDEPVQAPQPRPDTKPAQDVDPAKPLELVKPVRAAQLVEAAPVVKPIEPVEPTPTVKLVDPAPAVKPVKPAPAVKPVKPAPDVKPVEPARAVKAVESALDANLLQAAPSQQPSRPEKTSWGPRAPKPALRWRLAGLLVSFLLVLATIMIVAFARHQSPSGNGAGPSANVGGQRIAAESDVRRQAVTWIASQVGRDIIVGCDLVTCNDLAFTGFPAGNLNVLQPSAPDPYGADIIIATADLRNQFGSKLAATYAPEVIASFGSGANRIDIRVIAKQGPMAFRAALGSDLHARKTLGAALLHNSRLTAPPTVRQQLASGLVDLRLITTLAFLAAQRPVDIVDFGSDAPGAGPGVPLRFADLAETDTAAQASGPGYVQSLLAVLHAESPPYLPTSTGATKLASGEVVLRVEFSAPSLTGLPPS